MNLFSRFKHAKLWNAILLLLISLFGVIIVITYCFTKSPEGVYYDKNMGSVGSAYWVFEHGRVFIVTAESTNLLTTYFKNGDKWVYSGSKPNDRPTLIPTVFGLKILSSTNTANNLIFPRRFWSWMF